MTYSRSVRPRALALSLTLFAALLALHGTGCSSASGPSGSGSASNSDTTGDAASSCGPALVSVDASASEISMCFPDHDGINGGSYTIDLTVDDTGFSKTVIGTQNDAAATLTLKNTGTKPHGFEVECTSVAPAYATVPDGCPSVACFPSNSTIAPFQPGESKTITFDTPTPDGLNYPVRSSDPSDCAVPGLNGSETQWALM